MKRHQLQLGYRGCLWPVPGRVRLLLLVIIGVFIIIFVVAGNQLWFDQRCNQHLIVQFIADFGDNSQRKVVIKLEVTVFWEYIYGNRMYASGFPDVYFGSFLFALKANNKLLGSQIYSWCLKMLYQKASIQRSLKTYLISLLSLDIIYTWDVSCWDPDSMAYCSPTFIVIFRSRNTGNHRWIIAHNFNMCTRYSTCSSAVYLTKFKGKCAPIYNQWQNIMGIMFKNPPSSPIKCCEPIT